MITMITIFKNYFQNLGHSGSCLLFSCQHGIAYYSKFILLSLSYIPNIVVADVARIGAKHATSTRKNDAKYYDKGDKEGNIFNPFSERVADPD